MAIASVATEYVFSDFLLKDATEAKYKGVRLDLAVDKIVTFLAVGLPLFLISLAFAQEVSVGELLCGERIIRGSRGKSRCGFYPLAHPLFHAQTDSELMQLMMETYGPWWTGLHNDKLKTMQAFFFMFIFCKTAVNEKNMRE